MNPSSSSMSSNNVKVNSKRRNPPAVKQTLTSYKRMLKANPLLAYQIEGKPLPTTVKDVKFNAPIDKPPHILEHDKKRDNVNMDETASIRSRYPNYLKSSNRTINERSQHQKPTLIRKHKSVLDIKRQPLHCKNVPLRKSVSAENLTEQKCTDLNNTSTLMNYPHQQSDKHCKTPNKTEISTGIHFKTPSAYKRRSISFKTPSSACSIISHRTSTPKLPTHAELQRRLNDWLVKRGKCPSSYTNLKAFSSWGIQETDEENKENVEGEGIPENGSYEDLRIPQREKEDIKENINVARDALSDLLTLITEGYNLDQCENWLSVIREKYQHLEREPQFWECRAAIEQNRGNIGQAVECLQTAITNGAEVTSVDQSLDNLLEKFCMLNISTDLPQEKPDRSKMKRDAIKVFKSTIIQFAIHQRNQKKTDNKNDPTNLIATPVRRSSRLSMSKSNYATSSGIQLCTSLKELDENVRQNLDFKPNNALI